MVFSRCMFPTAQATATLVEETPATRLEVTLFSNFHLSGMLHFIFEKQVTPSTARLLSKQLSLTFLIRSTAKTSMILLISKTIHTETKELSSCFLNIVSDSVNVDQSLKGGWVQIHRSVCPHWGECWRFWNRLQLRQGAGG